MQLAKSTFASYIGRHFCLEQVATSALHQNVHFFDVRIARIFAKGRKHLLAMRTPIRAFDYSEQDRSEICCAKHRSWTGVFACILGVRLCLARLCRVLLRQVRLPPARPCRALLSQVRLCRQVRSTAALREVRFPEPTGHPSAHDALALHQQAVDVRPQRAQTQRCGRPLPCLEHALLPLAVAFLVLRAAHIPYAFPINGSMLEETTQLRRHRDTVPISTHVRYRYQSALRK
mmetsp:Transcript_13496/g.33866  ORF Transcript_13496/g.33866 Transcript_13496/m.33866 type:complete len:232 (+) Transcript_13496:399-1094(+)